MEIIKDVYMITDDKTKIDLNSVHSLLKQSHWAKDRPIEIISKSIHNSLCFSVYYNDVQIGFARVVSDYAVYSLVLDVIIDEKHRGKGLGKRMIDFIKSHPSIKNTNLVIWTKYADKLYTKCGFKEEDCYKFMFNRPK